MLLQQAPADQRGRLIPPKRAKSGSDLVVVDAELRLIVPIPASATGEGRIVYEKRARGVITTALLLRGTACSLVHGHGVVPGLS
jgi:hypothetical protein